MEPTPPSLGVRKRTKKTISDLLPIDLVMEIFKRLPVKTLARLICVSKLCASIIRSRDFMKVFLTNRHGRLFFTFKRYKDSILFTTSLQTLNPGEASVTMTHPAFDVDVKNCSSLHGLICYATACASRVLVYDSSTRKLTTLPIFQPGTPVRNHFLGYDGIRGVYKVLCMTGPNPVFQIMTLGDGTYAFHRFVDVNDAGELVLAPLDVHFRHYVLFYDPKRNSMRKVAVNGIKVPKRYDSNRRFNRPDSCRLLHLFSSQVESPMFL
ncbi:unnamed protein product [Brassica oleracea]